MKITYTEPTLEINGQAYSVLRTDAQIIEDTIQIDIAHKKALDDGMNEGKALIQKAQALSDYLETLLGKGATKRIEASIEGLPKGRGLGVVAAMKLCETIIARAGRTYAEAFTLKYGDGE